jgi:solute carrier family 13 (sodium-dependent dicarboxylate transporter), member 2/3/5
LVLLFLCWLYLVKIAFPMNHLSGLQFSMKDELGKLPPMHSSEKRVLTVFIFVATAWILRSFVIAKFLPAIDDAMIGIAGGILLFLVPSERGSNKKLLDWEDTKNLPWGILLLFGGGLALAESFKTSGLAEWFGMQLKSLDFIPYFLIILITVALVNFLTEITSNVATATLMLPITASMATAMGFSPYGIMIATCMASSCAFMLPVATPPNAVVFSGGHIQIRDMIKAGFAMNLISILLLTMVFYFFGEKLDGLF